MKRITFGEELLQFAKAVDILDKDLFFDIKQIINTYAKERWGVKYVKIMRLRFDEDGNRVLEKFFLNEYQGISNTGDFINIEHSKGQMAFVIKQRNAVWISCANKESYLNNCDKYIDHWSKLEDIPAYQNIASNEKMRTSIIVPFYEIEHGKDYLRGVVNYEIPYFVPFNEECKQEILHLTNTISELLNLYSVRERQERNTRFAIDKLKYKLENFSNSRRENKIFIASPTKGSDDVKNAIIEVIESDFPDIAIENWENNNITGSVTENIFDKINKCLYGICYFSQKDEEYNRYIDNINVAFEAGLMHSKFRTFKDEKPLWIPIREANSPTFPFDVKDFNTIVVPRNEDGSLNEEEFKKELTNFLLEMTKRIKDDIYEATDSSDTKITKSFIAWLLNINR
ncbi:MAG: hypothetical protein GXO60_01940 [Epsilonproteobacteria bacterium]|nr:hypothetical protein [Campylobacterota bacterium]